MGNAYTLRAFIALPSSQHGGTFHCTMRHLERVLNSDGDELYDKFLK